jgi:hypothetical protein
MVGPGMARFGSHRVGGGAGLAVGLDDQDPITVGHANEILDSSIYFSFDTMLLNQI